MESKKNSMAVQNLYKKVKEVCTAKSLLKFDDNIFNTLVDRIEILEPTHFVFVLKNQIKI